MPARLDLLHTRLLTLAARVGVRDGECGVRATEFSGSYRKALKTLIFREAHVLETIPIRAKKVKPTVATGSGARGARRRRG